jgi:hypothetical protein
MNNLIEFVDAIVESKSINEVVNLRDIIAMELADTQASVLAEAYEPEPLPYFYR